MKHSQIGSMRRVGSRWFGGWYEPALLLGRSSRICRHVYTLHNRWLKLLSPLTIAGATERQQREANEVIAFFAATPLYTYALIISKISMIE
jgi:hypothetical protein